MPELRLHDYGPSAQCLKVRILLAQLGLPYERVPVDIFGGDTLTDAFAARNPVRKTPVLETQDGRFLPESNAILWYLAEGTELLPGGRFERADVVRWLLFEQNMVIPALSWLRFALLTGRLTPDEPETTRLQAEAAHVLSLLDTHLAASGLMVGGRYSIADISLYGYTHLAPQAGIELAAYPAVGAWLRRVEGQPGFVNDLEPYPANALPGAGRSIYG